MPHARLGTDVVSRHDVLERRHLAEQADVLESRAMPASTTRWGLPTGNSMPLNTNSPSSGM